MPHDQWTSCIQNICDIEVIEVVCVEVDTLQVLMKFIFSVLVILCTGSRLPSIMLRLFFSEVNYELCVWEAFSCILRVPEVQIDVEFLTGSIFFTIFG